MKKNKEKTDKIENALNYALPFSIIGTFISFCYIAKTIIPSVVFLIGTINCVILLNVLRHDKSYDTLSSETIYQEKPNISNVTQEQEHTRVEPPAPKEETSLEYYREHCYESAEMYEKYFYDRAVSDAQQRMRDLLESEERKITKLLMTRKLDKAMEAIEEVLNHTDPIRDANARHWYLISALRDFYAIRDFDPIVYSYCLQICDYDLQYIENYFLANGTRIERQHDAQGRALWDEPAELVYHRNPPPNLETATKKAIILEKLGYIDEAIAYCEYAIEHDLPDTNGNSFLARKMRLEKKREKANKLQGGKP